MMLTSPHEELQALRQKFEATAAAYANTEREMSDAGRSLAGSNRGAILMYHRVAHLALDPAGLCVGPEVFQAQMEHLARTCEPISLDVMTATASSGRIPRRAVAITLDDGYLDAVVASDILCSLHVPATFFVNSSAGGETLIDSIARIFLEDLPLPAALDLEVAGTPVHAACATAEDRRTTFDTLRDLGYCLSATARRDLLWALYDWCGLDPAPRPSHRVLTPWEVRELASRPGHTIGAHTHQHLWLPAQPLSIKVQEMAVNRRYLEDVLGQDVSSFAYPYGAYDEETVRLCRSLGFRTAVTVEPRPVRPWDDSLLLPRQEIKNIDHAEFAMTVDALVGRP